MQLDPASEAIKDGPGTEEGQKFSDNSPSPRQANGSAFESGT